MIRRDELARTAAVRIAAMAFLAATGAANAATITVTNTNSGGAGSLAQAITTANGTVTADVIQFSLIGLGAQTIEGPFPAITQPLTIDGYTAPLSSDNSRTDETSNAVIVVELDGESAAGGTVLHVNSNDVTIRGLAIRGIGTNGNGILVAAGRSNVSILGNFIGTDAAGLADDSEGVGISVEGTARVGSALAEDRNVISGNLYGIELLGNSSIVENNLIGLDSDGGLAIGNVYGVYLSDSAGNNTIGGGSAANFIAANESGIVLAGDAGTGNRFFDNRFHDNASLGVDLGDDGPTLNDSDDSDTGPNGLLNAPELAFVRLNVEALTIRGTVRSAPGQYRVHLFGNPNPDGLGFGQGARKLGSTPVTIPPGQTAARFGIIFSGSSNTEVPLISAILEDETTGNSSEFSRTYLAVQGGTEIVVSNTSGDLVAGSLRAALSLATEGGEPNTIVFDIPGDGPHTIVGETPFPVNGGGTTIIDGYSQPGSVRSTSFEGSNAQPKIILTNGDDPALSVVSIDNGANVTLQGLVIQGGEGDGVRVGSADATLYGNFIGTNATGTSAVGNENAGVRVLVGDATIGSPVPAERNVISGNGDAGIVDGSEDGRIRNNLIGYSATLQPLGNGGPGVSAVGDNTAVGGFDPDFSNRIGHNGGAGVEVVGAGAGAVVRVNSIAHNGGLGIDLVAETDPTNGVTPNDADDQDVGPNALQNFPVITNVEVSSDSFVVQGTLDVDPSDLDPRFQLRIYASSQCDASGHGEGERHLASFQRELEEGESFSLVVPAALEPGEFVTMTATDLTFDKTSEFSACYATPGGVVCGDASGDEAVTATDALLVLRTAVGVRPCVSCICDVNGSASVTSSDALLVLRLSVGQQVTLDCPGC